MGQEEGAEEEGRDGGEDEDPETEDGEEEAEEPRVIRDPGKPSAREIEQHNMTHLPFRAWCSTCVAGRAKEDPHRKVAAEVKELGVPIVSSDFCFPGQQGEDNAIVLVTREHLSRSTFAHVVKSKSCVEDPWMVETTVKDIESMGLRTIIYRTDNEPAALELQEKVKNMRKLTTGCDTMIDNSQPRQSASAGCVEKAVQETEEQIRVLKIALEKRIGERISSKSCCFAWLVEYAAVLINRFMVGKDGLTPIRRLRGRASTSRPLAEFGEMILYKIPDLDRSRMLKLEARWNEGVWLGINPRTNMGIVGTPQGIIYARSIRRRPEGERWSADAVRRLRGTPSDPKGIQHQDEEAQEQEAEQQPRQQPRRPDVYFPDAEASIPIPRRTYITAEDYIKYGYTIGCPGCIAMSNQSKRRKPHTEACRARFRTAMAEDDQDKARVEEEDARIYDYMNKVKEQKEREEQRRARQQQRHQDPHSSPEKKRLGERTTQSTKGNGTNMMKIMRSRPERWERRALKNTPDKNRAAAAIAAAAATAVELVINQPWQNKKNLEDQLEPARTKQKEERKHRRRS